MEAGVRAAKTRKKGKKGRKLGNKKKKPAQVRYTQEKRWLRGKARRILRSEGADALARWKTKQMGGMINRS